MTDTPDWWQHVFSQREISELEQTATHIIDNQQPLADEEELSVTLSVPANQIPPLLERLAKLYDQTPEGECRDMINMIGIVLASEYYEHYDIYESPATTAAIGEFIDLDALESDDDEDSEDEDE